MKKTSIAILNATEQERPAIESQEIINRIF